MNRWMLLLLLRVLLLLLRVLLLLFLQPHVGSNVAAYVGVTGHGVFLPRTGSRDPRFPLGVVNFLDETVRSVIAAPMFDLNGSVVAVYMLARSGGFYTIFLSVCMFLSVCLCLSVCLSISVRLVDGVYVCLGVTGY